MRASLYIILFAGVMLGVLGVIGMRAPSNFPLNTPITIEKGLSERQVLSHLDELGVIKHALIASIYTRVLGYSSHLQAGRYVFDKPLPMWKVIARVKNGDFGTKQQKVTIPEGFTNQQIAKLLNLNLDDDSQGRLFPDTYYFDQYATAEEIKIIMQANFNKQIGEIDYDNLIVASILEEEASITKDRQIISGILWKRLDIDMPLQVDVATVTYERRGLPAMPITNPGKDAIWAAANPEESPYLYYLSDKEGVIHYARTFDGHKANRAKYGI